MNTLTLIDSFVTYRLCCRPPSKADTKHFSFPLSIRCSYSFLSIIFPRQKLAPFPHHPATLPHCFSPPLHSSVLPSLSRLHSCSYTELLFRAPSFSSRRFLVPITNRTRRGRWLKANERSSFSVPLITASKKAWHFKGSSWGIASSRLYFARLRLLRKSYPLPINNTLFVPALSLSSRIAV